MSRIVGHGESLHVEAHAAVSPSCGASPSYMLSSLLEARGVTPVHWDTVDDPSVSFHPSLAGQMSSERRMPAASEGSSTPVGKWQL